MGPDLDLDPFPIGPDDRGVERLVHVLLGKADVVFEFSRDRLPDGVDDSQDVITFLDRIDDDPEGRDVIDLIEIDVLIPHLHIDAVDLFQAARHFALDAVFVKLFQQGPFHFIDITGPFLLSLGDLTLDILIDIGMEVAKGQVLQFRFNPVDPETVGNGGIDIEGLLGNLRLLFRGVVLEGPHVMEPVSQLDQDHPDVLHHGENHLSEILCLALFGRPEGDLADLGQPIDQLGNLFSKVFLNIFEGGEGILNGVVEKAGGHTRRIEFHLGQDAGDLQGMNQVRLSGETDLADVDLCRNDIGLVDEVNVRIRIIRKDPVYDVIDS